MCTTTPPATPIHGVRLAVDVGKARVGVAACDSAGILASPIDTLYRDMKKQFDQKLLIRKIRERSAVRVYVGYPINLQGKETGSTEDAVAYAQQLADRLAHDPIECEVRLIDERLSTVTAHRQLHEAGRKSENHRSVVDQVAAAEILEHALNLEKSLGPEVGTTVTPSPSEGAQR